MKHQNGWHIYWEIKGNLQKQIWLGRLALTILGLILWGIGYRTWQTQTTSPTESISMTAHLPPTRNALSQSAAPAMLTTNVSSRLSPLQAADLPQSTQALWQNKTVSTSTTPRFPRHTLIRTDQSRRPDAISWVSASGRETWRTIQVAHRIPAATSHQSASQWAADIWFWPAWLPHATCGEAGVVSIAGHVSWYGRSGPFAQLGTIEPESIITCEWGDQIFNYQVEEIYVVPYSDTTLYQRPLPDAPSTLVLYSCTPEIDGIIVVKSRLIDPVTERGTLNDA